MTQLLKFLSTPTAVKYQVAWYLCCLRSASLLQEVYQLQAAPSAQAQEAAQEWSARDRARQRELARYRLLVRVFLVYQTVSNCVMVTSAIRYLFASQVERCVAFLMAVLDQLGLLEGGTRAALPPHCYVLTGEFLLTPNERAPVCASICLLHLMWRAHFVFLGRYSHYQLDLVDFLLHSPDQDPDLDDQHHKNHHENPAPEVDVFSKYVSRAGASNSAEEEEPEDSAARQMHTFVRRPHRTRENWLALHEFIASTTLCTSVFMLGLAAVIAPVCIFCLLSNYTYTGFYPRCAPELEQALASGQMSVLSCTLTWHHSLAILAGFTQNLCILLDSGIACTYVFALVIILQQDLVVYWRLLHAELERLLAVARAHHKADGLKTTTRHRVHLASIGGESLAATSDHHALTDIEVALEQEQQREQQQQWTPMLVLVRARASVGNRALATARGLPAAAAQFDVQRRYQWRAMESLEWQLYDAFQQISHVDKLISDFLTLAIMFWLFGLIVLNQQFVKSKLSGQYTGNLELLIGAVYFMCSIPITVVSFSSFRVYSLGLRTYGRLCSLVAHSQSSRELVRSYTVLGEFFTVRKRTAFSLFRSRPYLPSSFLTMIAWGFSCHVIVSNLYLQRRH